MLFPVFQPTVEGEYLLVEDLDLGGREIVLFERSCFEIVLGSKPVDMIFQGKMPLSVDPFEPLDYTYCPPVQTCLTRPQDTRPVSR
jgi:hypothetical protein